MRSLACIVVPLFLLALLAGCQDYGTRLEFAKGELFYKEPVTEAQAKAIGELLRGDLFTFFSDKRATSAQVVKEEDTFTVRLCYDKDSYTSTEGEKKEALDASFALLRSAIAALEPLEGGKIVIELCDEHMETFQTFKS